MVIGKLKMKNNAGFFPSQVKYSCSLAAFKGRDSKLKMLPNWLGLAVGCLRQSSFSWCHHHYAEMLCFPFHSLSFDGSKCYSRDYSVRKRIVHSAQLQCHSAFGTSPGICPFELKIGHKQFRTEVTMHLKVKKDKSQLEEGHEKKRWTKIWQEALSRARNKWTGGGWQHLHCLWGALQGGTGMGAGWWMHFLADEPLLTWRKENDGGMCARGRSCLFWMPA